ncbi:MAG TPA: sterol desaturase family protein [Acidimicrobiales bacterium]|nr:sterol desaturase family protein [Acidimicrobiales bacterium]
MRVAPNPLKSGGATKERGRNEGQTLRDAAAVFFKQPSPIAITAVLFAATIGRLYVGSYSWSDLLPPAVVLALQPFTEWLIHVFLLHFRPRTVGGHRIDPLVSRKHRAHHADPKDLQLVFIPGPALVGLLGGTAAVFLIPFSLPVGLSGLVGAYAMTLTYEWIHYLIHSSYRPRHRPYRYVWRAHRNHHYRNENYWFGVTVHLADHLLGTFPDKSAVEVSPTARTLGVDS